VLEKARNVAVVPAEMGWSDVGSWDAVHALGPFDAYRNVSVGNVVKLETDNCLIRSDGPLVAMRG
jgi:mannose-1-phosphate guanylyltransferase/mannose-1-phosphate guanylyltransferase/mannose-6-phosphate isomerase